MRKWIIISVLLVAAGCRGGGPYVARNGFALGTTYRFVVQSHDTSGLQQGIDSIFKVVDASMSVYNPNSLVNRINDNLTDSVDSYIVRCIEVATKMSELSGGEYDITIKPITQALGYAGGEGAAGGRIRGSGEANVDSLLQYVGYDRISIRDGRLRKAHPAMQLDLNSVAKGYTADLMAGYLDDRGIKNYMVEIGGEIFCRGRNPRGEQWQVGIDRPVDGNITPGADLQATISMSELGLATSGNYRQFYLDSAGRKVTHIVNAKTGRSGLSDVLSTTVIAPSCIEADAAATMLSIVGLERAIELVERQPDWAAYLVFDNGEGGFGVWSSDNFAGHLGS
jgi:thiamine biosynthesis lipoprotein